MILALDQGSSSSRCIAYDAGLAPVASSSARVETLRPQPGFVEHDAADLLAGARRVVAETAALAGGPVEALAIANQTESFLLWDRDTGAALTPVVSWQDQRAATLCARLADAAGAGHVTEPSNACRSLLFDIETLAWDAGLLQMFGLPAAMLPRVRPSDRLGLTTAVAACGFEAPLAAVLGDQPAALHGHGCLRPGMAALTLGTGAFLWTNAGGGRPEPPAGVLATIAWESAARGRAYALEAFCPNAGNALAVLRRTGLAGSAEAGPPAWGRPHPIVVPAPGGLGTPSWHPADRITVLAAGSDTTPEDLTAAVVAGVAHQIVDALDAAGVSDRVRVGGGLSANRALVQAIADLSGIELELSAEREATARGVAVMAAIATGAGVDPGPPPLDRRVAPAIERSVRDHERDRWRRAVEVHLEHTP